MRLIDADALIEAMKKTESEYENAMTCPSWWSAFNVISEQPTAYSVDKVVEEFEKKIKEVRNTEYAANTFVNESIRTIVINTISDLEEIVKQGCVYDDVCEWKQDKGCVGLGAYNISCCDKTLEMPISTARGLKFCPYCSKKIKAVE